MIRRLSTVSLVAILACLFWPLTAPAQEVPELQITSTHYLVIDAETGEVYAQRDAHDEVAIASLTKIFTAVQAVSMAPLDTPITTDESDLRGTEATTMGFGAGETYTLEDMIYGMLLPSGNDAAHAIARTLGGQPGDTPDEAVERFMTMVNQRVADMGLKDTHLITPDGWGVPGHHSSAWDVAAFMRYAMEYPFLVDVMGTRSYTTSNGYLTVTNTNKMMNTYAALLAGKTGYDDDAGWCLVNIAEASDGTRMIAVTLDGVAPDDWYDDNMVLLEYGFDRHAEIASSNERFDGDVVAYTNPAAAELARTGEASGALQGEIAREAAPQPATSDAPELSRANGDSGGLQLTPERGRWLAIMAAIALVGARGALHWRDTAPSPIRRRRAVDTVALDS
jgi:serine-type D-Ala-D-Ala carboxypeptidase (penicillin-binding protein 5/6)